MWYHLYKDGSALANCQLTNKILHITSVFFTQTVKEHQEYLLIGLIYATNIDRKCFVYYGYKGVGKSNNV